LNPYERIPAATMGWSAGVKTEYLAEGGVQAVTDVEHGGWIGLSGVDFGSGAGSFQASVLSLEAGGVLELHLDDPAGPVIGKLQVPAAGGAQEWLELKTAVQGAEGVHNLYLVFTGESGKDLFKLAHWQFTPQHN
jgi:arabinoxylan arabinofuranohydrolase